MKDTRIVTHYHFDEGTNSMEISQTEVTREFEGTFWLGFTVVLAYLIFAVGIGGALAGVLCALITGEPLFVLACCSLFFLLLGFPVVNLYDDLVRKRTAELGTWDDIISQERLEQQQEEQKMKAWRDTHLLEEAVRVAMETKNPNAVADLLREVVQLPSRKD